MDLQDGKMGMDCMNDEYDSLQIGCGASQDSMEFKSSCLSTGQFVIIILNIRRPERV